MTLTGILKNILLVIISVMIWHTNISWIQFLGYAVALGGLVYYSIGWDQITTLSQTLWVYTKGGYESVSGNASVAGEEQVLVTSAVRRALIMGAAALTVMVLAGAFFYSGGAVTEDVVGTTA